MRALVISSDMAVQERMKEVLAGCGSAVDSARSTEKAMYYVRTMEYDIIVIPDFCDGRFAIKNVAETLQRLPKVKNSQFILIETSLKLSTALRQTLRNKTILKIRRAELDTFKFEDVLKPVER